ncbi:MAG: C10 family peptidase [Treponema sp.]|nr:C10 family peptidase [Treponema sp.]
MKTNPCIIAFLITLILILIFSSGYLFAQEAGDREDSAQEGAGVSFIPNDDELASILTTQPNPHAVVRPLIQSKWHQGFPFNSNYPLINGRRAVAGCGPVAIAQLLYHHRHPIQGRGEKTGNFRNSRVGAITSINYNVSFDWANMLNTYRSDGKDSSEQQQNAVGRLFYYVAASYPYYQELVNHFGYDRSIQRPQRVFYTDAEWEALIRQQLDAGLPVYYWGNDPESDHAFIVDGYDSQGRFHINWGWGGRHDGWYSLNNLNPGNRNRSWYNNQRIMINIKPDAGGVSAGYEMALMILTADKNSVTQNEMFIISARLRNISILDVFPGGQIGIALVDNNGRIMEVIGSRNRAALNPQSLSSSIDINCFVPETVRPGRYRLMTVIRPEGGNWRVVTKSAVGSNIPNAIDLTVTAGEANGGGYGMALTAFTASKTTVSQNELFTVTPTIRNVAAEAFPGGQLGAALVDNNGRIAAVIGTRSRNALNPGSASNPMEINCFVPNTVRPGQYRLRIVVQPANGEWKVATLANAGVPTNINFTVTAAIERNYTGTWRIQLGNGRLVDIREQNSNNGIVVIQQDRNGGRSQQWSFERHNDGTYTITNVQSNRVLEVQNSRIAENGARIQQWQNNNTPGQRWRIITAGEFVRFQNVASGKLLDMSRSNYNNVGHQFHQWDCNAGENQQFRLEAVR